MSEQMKNDDWGFMWLITLHNNDNQNLTYEQIEQKLRSTFNVFYFCISTEISDNGSLHYHVFIYLRKNPAYFSQLKSLFKSAHLDKCRASNPHDVVNYVKKSGRWENSDKKHTQIDGDGRFYESGFLFDYSEYNKPNKQWRDFSLDLDNIMTLLPFNSHEKEAITEDDIS